jgi:hypothetical protein
MSKFEQHLDEVTGSTKGSIRVDLRVVSKLKSVIERDFQALYMPLVRSVNAQKKNKKYIAHETMEEWGELQGDLTELFNKIEISIENREEK